MTGDDHLEAIRRDHDHQRPPLHVDRAALLDHIDHLQALVEDLRDANTRLTEKLARKGTKP